MIKNVGSADRIIRIVIGLFLLSMLFWVEGASKWFGLIGIIPIATAFMNSCPLYIPLKINTLKKKLQK